jgi:pilus assembly protein Flp/PilA
MSRLTALARRFGHQEDGATLLEYGMLVLLIAAICVLIVKAIGTKVSNGFNTVNSALP